MDFYQVAPGKGSWLGRFSLPWGIAFLVFTVACTLFLSGILFSLWFHNKTSRALLNLIWVRNRSRRFCWLIAIAVVIIHPVFLLFTKWGASFTSPLIRCFTLVTGSVIFAICISHQEMRLLEWDGFFNGMVTIASAFLVANLFTNVTNYPFALSWSEGNRLYDYSIYTDPSRYQFVDTMEMPYSSPGRYILWGILFLIPGTPIWLHRLWDALLWIVPCILFGFLLSRWNNLATKEKWIYVLWIFLFLSQGPIYPPLMLSAILVVLFVRSGRWAISLVVAAVASYYASASRWSWLPASPTWSTLVLLSGLKLEPGEKWKKVIRDLIPIAVVALVSLFAGSLASPGLYSPKEFSSSMAFSQPLLWYRLLPNSTFQPGILGGTILAVTPIIFLLVWMAVNKRWKLNWVQVAAACGACLVFLVVGMIASVKIGGGSNLHNLDMFLVTLALLSGLVLQMTRLNSIQDWPGFTKIALILLLFLPCWNAFSKGAPLELPPETRINQALDFLRNKVSIAEKKGNVLFIDQRQLIVFNYINDLPMVSRYEKKYLMDQAMAGNEDYYSGFYEDLSNKRFALIITEPLFTKEQDTSRGFSEENNAWVKWAAKPLLCYYAPVKTFTDVNLQILTPRDSPTGCP
jgi:hypothetical protein